MKITFFSNFLNHHQLPFCQEMIKLHGDDFKFVATEEIPKERIKLGYEDMNNKYDFVIKSYENEKEAYGLADESDVVIIGSAPTKYITNRIKNKKLTFRYSERIFKNYNSLKFIKSYISIFLKKTFVEKNVYLLCASAFSTRDYNIAGAYINRCYKWGYFPKIKEYIDIQKIINNKIENSILWVGRFIDFKHPEIVIKLANELKNNKNKFKITMIGTGELKATIINMIKEDKLEDVVEVLDSMSPNEVRKYMEKSQIYLFTSDKGEGWGAVLNESMNSACAVIANSVIGSAPFLIEDEKNGLMYNNGNFEDLVYKVEYLLDNKNKCNEIGKMAYYTMLEKWSPKIAAERITNLSENLLTKSNANLYEDGPCSKAKFVKDNWYKNNNLGKENNEKDNI